MSLNNTTKNVLNLLPVQAGSGLFRRYTSKVLRVQFFASLLLCLFIANTAHAALELKTPPAMLTWSLASRPAYSNVTVLRYDQIGFYYYDPASPQTFTVWEGHAANKDSLDGTPIWLSDVLPAPISPITGMPLALNGPLPLTKGYDRQFAAGEPMFIVAEGLILPSTAYGTRPDGRNFVAVTIDVEGGLSYITTLTETAPGSHVYAGYLQPNLASSSIVIPPNAEVKIRYDDYGDVPDSQTIYSPWNVALPGLEFVLSHRRATTDATPLPDNPLFLRKQVQRTTAAVGDFVKYQLAFENVGLAALPAVEVVDVLPQGFRYQANSTKIDAVAVAPMLNATGQEITFKIGTVAPGQIVNISYVVEVTALTPPGQAINRAIAHSGKESSGLASAMVMIEQSLNNDRSFLLGRVIAGECGEDTAPGVEGVRIYMEDGTNVVTDAKGRWTIAGVTPGLHVIQLDSITLQPNHLLRPCLKNSRQAGNALSRFVDVQGGTLWRENWYVEVMPDSPEVAAQKAALKIDPEIKPGFVNLYDGITFPQPVFSAIAQLDSRLKVKLLLNGQEVSENRIGMRMPDKETKLTRYTWIGLELDKVGAHTLEVQGVDPFGNTRFEQKIEIRRSGRIKTIRLLDAKGNSADGRTPVAIHLQLIDEFDKPITSGAELKVTAGELRPLNISQRRNPLEANEALVQVDSQGVVRFEPVGNAGNYRITLAADDNVKAEMVISVAPDLREWILVGFAEGTVGYNTLSGNMSQLKGEENHTYVKGDVSFFARGQIKEEWLLTAAYDSRRNTGDNALMQRVDPQKWYVLYGDDTFRGHDAPTKKKLYVRIERADFLALFGDFDTGLNITELASYQRTLTGFKSEYSGRNLSAVAFAAQTDQGFMRDDIPADGTSGLYRLSRGRLLPGSDVVEIEVRDRFTNEVLATRQMARYIDYNIDYMDGTFYFRSPVLRQDAYFNPQRIVVKYEVTEGAQEWVAGGRVSVHDADKKLEVGLTAVDDQQVQGSLAGVDLTWKPNEANTVKAEIAGSQLKEVGNSAVNRTAWLVEHTYTSEKFDSRVKVEQQEGDFGLGQQANDDDDTRSLLVSTRYRVNEEWSLTGDMTHQEILDDNNQRLTAEGRVEYTKPDWQAYSGVRYAREQLTSGSDDTQQWVVGGRRSFLDHRLTLSARGETSFHSNSLIDYPNLLSLGADYQLTHRVALFANQELSWGTEQTSYETRMGVRTSPWEGGMVTTEVSRAQDEFGPRMLAHSGLFQTVRINDFWSADFGLDRSQTISSADAVVPSEQFDDRRPAAFGSRNDDYIAVYAGVGYQTADWQFTNRVEYRHAETDDKWTYMSGFHHRLDDTDSLTGRILYFDQQMPHGFSNSSAQLDVNYSRRPLSDSWFWLNRTQLIFDEQTDLLVNQQGRRLINNSVLNFVAKHRHQLSLQYGARYVRDTIDDELYTGYSDLIGGEYRFDITPKWDLGVRGSLMNSYNSDVHQASYGLMAGVSPFKNVWISLGYNFKGFYDKDFDGAESRVQGVVVGFRIKFDQNSVKRSKSN